jgi:hypothetical protein
MIKKLATKRLLNKYCHKKRVDSLLSTRKQQSETHYFIIKVHEIQNFFVPLHPIFHKQHKV